MRNIRNCSDDYRPVRVDLAGIGLVIESELNGYNNTIFYNHFSEYNIIPFSDHGGPLRDDTDLLDTIAVRPEDSASQQQQTLIPLPSQPDPDERTYHVPESTLTVVSNDTSSYARLASGAKKQRCSFVWNSEKGGESKNSKGKIRWKCHRCRNPRTSATYSDTSTKNAIIHLRNVHRIGQDGQLMDPAEQEQKLAHLLPQSHVLCLHREIQFAPGLLIDSHRS
ncbi:hypothetical protein BDD12DRAFT_807786 [Trichophaea hybrida]|nr:hypothetical protein BDD12DRAFT_807786 [Trichophaea hybrida]